jgi:DNA polymerase-3 subunit beta
MKFVIARTTLQKELAFVQGIVERKNTIPVLANILLESTGDTGLRITATDLDVTITSDLLADEISVPGAICVQARKLFDIARLLPDGPVTFVKEENDWVTVKAGQSKFKLPGVSAETFPDRPSLKETPFQFPASLVKSLFEQTIFAITQEESRYNLSGAKLEVTATETKIITTDGHRLALVKTQEGIKNDQTLDVLIPRKTLAEIIKLSADFDGDITFGADENHVYFQIGTRTLISRLLTGNFPNYEMVLPKGNDQKATFDTSALSKALRRVALMADNRSRAIKFTLDNQQLTISAQNAEDGEANESVPTDFAGPQTDIGFNAQYLQDFLNVAGTERISFEFKDASSQAELQPISINPGNFSYILMPLRL